SDVATGIGGLYIDDVALGGGPVGPLEELRDVDALRLQLLASLLRQEPESELGERVRHADVNVRVLAAGLRRLDADPDEARPSTSASRLLGRGVHGGLVRVFPALWRL